jgi:hypothetical protein
MSYFNHAFQKTFVGTSGFTGLAQGKLGTPGNILKGGQFAFVDAKTWNVLATDAEPGCCNLVLAAGSIYANDKIGPFHGGYLESNKSKEINPKYVNRFYRVDPCAPSANVIHVGKTPYTDDRALSLAIDVTGTGLIDGVYTDIPLSGDASGSGLIATITVVNGEVIFVAITNGGTGWTTGETATLSNEEIPCNPNAECIQPEFIVTAGVGADCCVPFYCGETYSLRLDVKGSPALRYLNHNAYLIADAYTGCCPTESITPTEVDSTLVYINWANAIVRSPLINPFILPVVIDESGVAWYAPGTDADFLAAFGVDTWDHYVSAGHVDGDCGGMVLNGAYVDTKFGDCTFQISDFYEKEPVKLYASLVDLNGDPCEFESLCVITECAGQQAMGLGESVARDVILSEAYRQNFFATDLRIREITQGTSVWNYIDRTSLYTRYYIQHNVPRFNNPSSTFDNDQYLLEVITDGQVVTFEDFVIGWLDNCSQCSGLDVVKCTEPCVSIVPNVNTWD